MGNDSKNSVAAPENFFKGDGEIGERILSAISENTSELIYVKDRESRMIYANPATLAVLGIPAERAIGSDAAAIFSVAGEADEINANDRRIMESGAAETVEEIYTGAGGETRVYLSTKTPLRDANGAVVGLIGISRDITERKLRDAERERMAAVMEASPEFIGMSDTDGKPIFLNRAGREMVGLDADADVGAIAIAEYFVPEERAFIERVVLPAVVNEGRWEGELTFQHFKTGARIPVLYDLFRVDDPNTGEPLNFATVTRDITERKRAEANLAFLADLAECFARLTSADEILRVCGEKIAHFLNISACLFAEINETQDEVKVSNAWVGAGGRELNGVYRLSDYVTEEFQRAARAGEIIVARDTQNDSRVDAQAYAAYDIGAFVSVPFRRAGEWKYLFTVNDNSARDWRADEIELVREFTSRIFPRLERARAEEALRVSEEKYRTLFNSIDEGFTVLEMIFDDDGKPIDYLHLENNPAQQRMTGMPDVTGKRIREVILDIEDFWIETFGRVALTGEAVRFENYLEGLNRWFDVYASRIGGAGSRQVALIYSDVTERKRAEDALRESERRFRNMADHAPVMIWMTEPDASCSYLSQSWYEFTGQTPETALGFGWLEATHPDDAAESERIFVAANERREAFRLEYRLRRGDGSYAWAIDSAQPRFSETGEFLGYIGSVIDISERRAAEQAVRKSEAEFRTLANAVPQIVWVTDGTGKTEYVNDVWTRFSGLNLAQTAEPETVAEAIHPEDRETVFSEWARAFESGEPFEIEARMKEAATGDYCWFLMRSEPTRDAQGNIVKWFGTSTDITANKEAEEAVRESEEKFRNLANSISQLAWIAEANGDIYWYNQRWFDYTGTTLSEMQGWGWRAVHAPDEVERVTEKFKHHIASGEIWEDTFPLKSKTGEYRWFLSRALPIRNERGEVVRWFGTNTDVEEIRQARLQAENANRLKDEFLATVSHELRTPLNAILGWASMLQSGKANEEIRRRANETIYRSAKSQAQLIEDLLDVSRIITGKMRLEARPAHLSAIVESAINTLRPAAEAKSIRLETFFDGGKSCVITGDAQRLQQIVWNLISNAVKFTPDGGQVAVKLENDNSYARLTVSDSGKGIEPEFLPFMFERFSQEDGSTTRRHGGLGLGLAIVRHLVELHGGRISATSAGLGFGSAFTVELPLLASPVQDEKSPDGKAKNLRESLSDGFSEENTGARQLTGISVLLVDDELDTLELLDAALTAEGADVRVASSAADAFEIFQDWKPDVLVSDIAMPDEDGYSLLKRVRALAPDEGGRTPAIAMTAYVRVEDRMRVLKSGFQMYVPKPAEPFELTTAIVNLVEKKKS